MIHSLVRTWYMVHDTNKRKDVLPSFVWSIIVHWIICSIVEPQDNCRMCDCMDIARMLWYVDWRNQQLRHCVMMLCLCQYFPLLQSLHFHWLVLICLVLVTIVVEFGLFVSIKAMDPRKNVLSELDCNLTSVRSWRGWIGYLWSVRVRSMILLNIASSAYGCPLICSLSPAGVSLNTMWSVFAPMVASMFYRIVWCSSTSAADFSVAL